MDGKEAAEDDDVKFFANLFFRRDGNYRHPFFVHLAERSHLRVQVSDEHDDANLPLFIILMNKGDLGNELPWMSE